MWRQWRGNGRAMEGQWRATLAILHRFAPPTPQRSVLCYLPEVTLHITYGNFERKTIGTHLEYKCNIEADLPQQLAHICFNFATLANNVS